jgi:ribonuclease D
MPNFRDYLMSEDNLAEVLSKADPAAKWIKDFVKSDNPKFEGKSKKERIKMALGAYYAKQRNEEVESVDESARERLARMMQDKAMVKNPPKIPTPAERRAKEQEKAKKEGMAKKAKAIQTQEEVESIDEISQELKTAYTQKAKAQVKELEPFAKKKSEYRDLAKNLIAKRQKGIAKANEELADDSLDEQIHHWSVHHGEGTIKNYTDKKTAKAEYDRVKQGRYGKYAKLVPVKQEDVKKLKSYADAVFKKYGAGGGIEEGK